jgi:hypothetical protein
MGLGIGAITEDQRQRIGSLQDIQGTSPQLDDPITTGIATM